MSVSFSSVASQMRKPCLRLRFPAGGVRWGGGCGSAEQRQRVERRQRRQQQRPRRDARGPGGGGGGDCRRPGRHRATAACRLASVTPALSSCPSERDASQQCGGPSQRPRIEAVALCARHHFTVARDPPLNCSRAVLPRVKNNFLALVFTSRRRTSLLD